MARFNLIQIRSLWTISSWLKFSGVSNWLSQHREQRQYPQLPLLLILPPCFGHHKKAVAMAEDDKPFWDYYHTPSLLSKDKSKKPLFSGDCSVFTELLITHEFILNYTAALERETLKTANSLSTVFMTIRAAALTSSESSSVRSTPAP